MLLALANIAEFVCMQIATVVQERKYKVASDVRYTNPAKLASAISGRYFGSIGFVIYLLQVALLSHYCMQ